MVSFVSIIPFFIFFFFTAPCSDDIFYHNYALNKTTWEFLVNHYNTWTGRYFSNLMMAVNPFTLTSNPNVYPIMMLSLFLFFTASLFFLFRVITKHFSNADDQKHFNVNGFILAIITLALYLHKMPRVTDTFYWFAGTSSHLLPMCFILFSIGLYIRGFKLQSRQMGALSVIFASLSGIIVCGSNETLALQWIFILGFAFLYNRIVYSHWERVLILPFSIAILSFLFLYFAPGNEIRAKDLSGGHSLVLMLYKPLGLVIETAFRYLSLSLIAFVLLFFPKIKKLNNDLSMTLKSNKSRYSLYLFGFGIFGLTFVPSVWTMGSLPPHRVLNNTYLFFILLGAFLILVSAHEMNFLDRWAKRVSYKGLIYIFFLSQVALFNSFYAWKDFFNLPNFIRSRNSRELILASAQNTHLIVQPLGYYPTTFLYEDITTNAGDYRNIVVAEFYKLKSVTLSKDYGDPK